MKEELLFNIITEKLTNKKDCIEFWRVFLKELNLKTDTFGWCSLDLLDYKAETQFKLIKQYCEINNLLLKGFLNLEEEPFESDWYVVRLVEIDMSTRAYTVPNLPFISDAEALCVASEDVYNIVNEHDLKGVRFSWVTDNGKYASKQFFNVIVDNMVPYIYSCKQKVYEWDGEDYKLLNKYSNNVKLVVDYIYDLSLYSPVYIPAFSDDLSFLYYNWSFTGFKELLINKRVVDLLVKSKICSMADFKAIKTTTVCAEGYRIFKSTQVDFVTSKEIEKQNKEYQKYNTIDRPVFIPNKENSIKLLKKVKSISKKYFEKGIHKSKIEGNEYSELIPYYEVCDGGVLSCEYSLHSYAKSTEETRKYNLLGSDLLIEIPKGLVIGSTADGDYIIFNDKVYRISHEDFNMVSKWDSIHSFIYCALCT